MYPLPMRTCIHYYVFYDTAQQQLAVQQRHSKHSSSHSSSSRSSGSSSSGNSNHSEQQWGVLQVLTGRSSDFFAWLERRVFMGTHALVVDDDGELRKVRVTRRIVTSVNVTVAVTAHCAAMLRSVSTYLLRQRYCKEHALCA
jgi:hypothetical protein